MVLVRVVNRKWSKIPGPMKILMDMDYLVVTRNKIFLQIKNLGTIKNMKMFLKIKKIYGQTGLRSQIGSW